MPKRRTIAVAGMTCIGCETNVENALKNVPGVRRVEADHDDESVEGDVDDPLVVDAVYDAGYEFVG